MKLLIDLQGAQTESRFRGIGRQARELAASLIAAAGAHDVQILLNAGLTAGFEALHDEFSKILPPGDIKFFEIPGAVREIDRNNLWRMRAAELYREAFIADLKPDVLYVSSLFEGVVDDAVTSIGLMQAPYATAATLFDLIPLYDPAAYLGADFMRNFYYRRAQSLKRADRLVAISESAKNEAVDMLQIPADRIDVALLAADPSFKQHTLSQDDAARLRQRYSIPKSFILYVGAIEPRKNIPLILEAFGKLTPEQRSDTALVFGGRLSESERVQLRTDSVRFGVDTSRLLLPGYIAEEDLAPLYGLSKLFVFPSMQEGFGLPPLEAMACGAPVLVARNSSLPEVVGREDQLFGTFDADELAAKMGRILTDETYAAELRAWGVERASQFSWSETGRRTLESLERLHDDHRASLYAASTFKSRPKLAFVSPLLSDRTGIAIFGSALLKELACYYDIECIISGTIVTDSWVLANYPLRDVNFFRRNADTYDYVLYQFGNSEFHAHMFDLLIEVPGVVILHDFYLSGVLDWLGNIGRTPKAHFLQQLYLTHGIDALAYAAKHGRHSAAERYPSNQIVFQNALGVIVHSQWSIDRAMEIYSDRVTERITRVPLLRAVRAKRDKSAARKRLGIPSTSFVVSTFGFVAETKLGDRLVEAWARTATARAGGMLIFVGDQPAGPWGEQFSDLVDETRRTSEIAVTGFTSDALYDDYLAASDIAVQLRRNTRGETSGAALDCMAAGLPLILNDHGPFTEFGPEIAVKISDNCTPQEIAEAIDRLFHNQHARDALSDAGRAHLISHNHPAIVGRQVRDALERFSTHSASAHEAKLLAAVSHLYAPIVPSDADMSQLSQIIAKSRGRLGPRRIFFDITLLIQSDAHTGIERVVRSFLSHFLAHPPAGHQFEPVRFENGGFHFARSYIAQAFELPTDVLPDSPIDYDQGDIYIMLEWAAALLPDMTAYLQGFRKFGGRVVICIYDLLPLLMPHRFPDFIAPVAQRWFQSVLTIADQISCISRCVADDVLRFGNALASTRSDPIQVDYFHIAADISSSVPTAGLPDNAEHVLERLEGRISFIMVGTVEPRKGHQQVIDAFNLLWDRNVDVDLTIVGREGWSVDTTTRSIRTNRENGGRLNWISDASDEYLERLYKSSTALIAASEGEGFGLPLIEGAVRGLPLLARDIPVFREVAGNHAFYFEAATGAALADAIMNWLALYDAGTAPNPAGLKVLKWDQSVAQFEATMFGRTSYGLIGGQ